jgi:heptosyltransferase-2
VPKKTFDRTLVIRGGALGDFLLTLPAIKALREASAHLSVLAYPQVAELARAAGLADSVRSIEYGPLAGFFARGAVHDPELHQYFSSFDPVVSYLYDPDEIFGENMRAAGVKRFIAGTHKPAAKAHAIDQLAEPLAALVLSPHERAVELRLPGAATRPWLLAIHPGSGSSAKNWPAENWKTLVRQLLAEHPQLRIALIGGEADSAVMGALGELRKDERVDFWENLPLCSLATNLATAQAYIGHDTGVSHLAAVLGVPSLLLFGPTNPAVWAPPHHHVRVLRAPGGDLSQLNPSTVLSAAAKHPVSALLA